ncbi:hypothetical protein DICVIV_07335 [Dictyocaulus viviparus]|uniref:Uncharacterized protein n=1 Tax=Dictyocaulus viviparus TaxID=29172 RepID=A0A0D8XPW5_DICVI|nr:hypothetical protein DICVIV_07335 [Dictyocaulus viviparus]
MISVLPSVGEKKTMLIDQNFASTVGKCLEKRGKQISTRKDDNVSTFNETFLSHLKEERRKFIEMLDNGHFINEQRRLVEEMLDSYHYEKNVHPRIDHLQPTRVNVSMTLYQILEVWMLHIADYPLESNLKRITEN